VRNTREICVQLRKQPVHIAVLNRIFPRSLEWEGFSIDRQVILVAAYVAVTCESSTVRVLTVLLHRTVRAGRVFCGSMSCIQSQPHSTLSPPAACSLRENAKGVRIAVAQLSAIFASKAHAKQTGVPLLGRRPSEEAGAAGVMLQIVQLPLSRVAQHLQTPSGLNFNKHITGHASWLERVLQMHAARGCCLPQPGRLSG